MPTPVDNLQKVAFDFTRYTTIPRSQRDLSRRIAEALDWTKGIARTNPVQFDAGTIQITRGSIGPQPAVVFATSLTFSESELLQQVALYAYHASIPWGLVATRNGAHVFNSHWILKDEWFHLPLIRWGEAQEDNKILRAVTPSGMVGGDIERVAMEVSEPDRFLLPVDDALVERLDHWRIETLRYSRNVSNVDEHLQTLFAQLFILRAVEDRKLARSLPSLSSVLRSNEDVDIRKLRLLLKKAQKVIGSDLFELNVLKHIPELVLRGIINDLYVPRNLPTNAARYNFAWMDADVLGLAYEKYLSTILAPTAPPPQLSLFEQPLRDVERISVRKSGGVYYTPNYLVKYLTERSLDHFEETLGLNHVPKIADFACGSGSFLVAAVDSLIRRLREREPKKNWVPELVKGKHIFGIDVDKRAVTMARLALWLRFAEEPDPLPLPRLNKVIAHGDSLGNDLRSTIHTQFDLVLGNPPFIATGRTPNREDLVARFKTAQGRFDYSYLFVELAIEALKPSGILGLVITNRVFRNKDANILREIITSQTDILELADFGSNEVFRDISAYIGTIIAKKNEKKIMTRAQDLRVINVLDVSSHFLSALLINAATQKDEVRSETLAAYAPFHPRGDSPWILVSPSAQRNRTRLENASETLGTIAGVFQGIRTGANDIFIITIQSGETSPIAKVLNGLGESGLIEKSLLHPVIFGSDIQRYRRVSATQFLIYPYRNNVVIAEQELRSKYPQAFKYLERYHNALANRTSIQDSGLRWYELVRKRDEAWLQSPKLLIRDLATETSFAIDELGNTFLVGGTAIVPADSELLLPLLGYLNSNLVNQYLAQITPLFKRGFQKFEPQHLNKIPVLTEILSKGKLAEMLATQAIRILDANEIGSDNERRAAEEQIENLLHNTSGPSTEGIA